MKTPLSTIILLLSTYCLVLKSVLMGNCPTTIDISNSSDLICDPKITMDAIGNVMCVWKHFEGRQEKIVSARKNVGECLFLPPETCPACDCKIADLSIATGVFRDTIAIWQAQKGEHCVIQASRKPFMRSWTIPVDLSPPDVNAYDPQIFAGAGGDVLAVWQLFNGTNHVIQSSRLIFDAEWEAPVNISPEVFNASLAKIAIHPHGDGVAIWQLDDGNDRSILQCSVMTIDGIWHDPTNLSSFPISGTKIVDTQLAIANSGDVIAAWVLDHSDGTRIVQVATKLRYGSWTNPINLSNKDGKAYHPQIAVTCEGKAVINWQFEREGQKTVVQSSVRREDGNWENAVDISQPEGVASDHKVGMTYWGDVIAIWSYELEGGYQIIQYAIKKYHENWISPVNLSNIAVKATSPQLAIDPFNRISVVWQSQDSQDHRFIQFSDQVFMPVPEPVPPPPSNEALEVLSPSEFTGKIVPYMHKMKIAYKHVLSWSPSPDPTVIYYKIYHNGKRIGKVSSQEPLKFTNKKIEKNQRMEYFLVAVNAQGIRSHPLKLVLE